MSASNFAPSLSTFWKLIEGSGHDPEPLFRELGINHAVISDPSARVSYAKVEAIWAWMEHEISDPCIGLRVEKYWHPSASGPLGYAWLASSSLRTAIGRLLRYMRLLTEGVQLLMDEADDTVALVIDFNAGRGGLPIQADGILAVLIALCRINYGRELNPVSVHLSHPKPTCDGEFFAYFKCPVYFDASDNRLLLPVGVLDEQLPGSNPQLAQLNDRIMIEYLARLDKDNIIERVKAVIIDQLPTGSVVDSGVADTLHMNVRSLQRKLQQKDTSFKKILNEVREDLALKYIKDSSLTVSEISFLLGFAETSSFSRAFKRWTGGSPKAYREGP